MNGWCGCCATVKGETHGRLCNRPYAHLYVTPVGSYFGRCSDHRKDKMYQCRELSGAEAAEVELEIAVDEVHGS